MFIVRKCSTTEHQHDPKKKYYFCSKRNGDLLSRYGYVLWENVFWLIVFMALVPIKNKKRREKIK